MLLPLLNVLREAAGFDCVPPVRLHVGQYELEPGEADREMLPPHVGQYAEPVELLLPVRAAVVLLPTRLPLYEP